MYTASALSYIIRIRFLLPFSMLYTFKSILFYYYTTRYNNT